MSKVTGPGAVSPSGASTRELVARHPPGSPAGAGNAIEEMRRAYAMSPAVSTVATVCGRPCCHSATSSTMASSGSSDQSRPGSYRPGDRLRAGGAVVLVPVLTAPLSPIRFRSRGVGPVVWEDRRRTRGHPEEAMTDVPPELAVRREAPDRNLALELVRVTEAAAMAAGRWVGRGDKNGG